MHRAALLHDIGKVGVPSAILDKPSKLSDDEYRIIKRHPGLGVKIIAPIKAFKELIPIVGQHHERFDGSGYPNGLSGEDILLEARIMAVADVVEAMASHRPYRASLGIDIALKEIVKNRGILYDPQVADVCLRLFNDQGYRF